MQKIFRPQIRQFVSFSAGKIENRKLRTCTFWGGGTSWRSMRHGASQRTLKKSHTSQLTRLGREKEKESGVEGGGKDSA